jgi:O-methyltransferase
MSKGTAHKILKALRHRFRQIAWSALGPEPGYMAQFGCIRCAASFLAWNQIEGDYLEFGVYEGASFAAAYHSIWNERRGVRDFIATDSIKEWYRNRPRFFAFDSFSGLPGGEAERHKDYEEGAYSCSEAGFLENMKKDGVNLKDVITHAGFYDETLTPETKQRLKIKKASLVVIDCDLYESTVPVLDFITDLVGQGTIIVFDDWYRYEGRQDKGEQRACREWLEKNPQIQLVQYWQQGPQAVAFIVHMQEMNTK